MVHVFDMHHTSILHGTISLSLHMQDAGLALMHMLRAHAGAYRAIKAMPGQHRYYVITQDSDAVQALKVKAVKVHRPEVQSCTCFISVS